MEREKVVLKGPDGAAHSFDVLFRIEHGDSLYIVLLEMDDQTTPVERDLFVLKQVDSEEGLFYSRLETAEEIEVMPKVWMIMTGVDFHNISKD
jgi:hypothetical protein